VKNRKHESSYWRRSKKALIVPSADAHRYDTVCRDCGKSVMDVGVMSNDAGPKHWCPKCGCELPAPLAPQRN